MKQAFLLLIFSITLITSCGDLCNASASCIGPPGGNFQDGEINLAFYKEVLEKQEDGSFEQLFVIDSILITTQSATRTIRNFYTWNTIGVDEVISTAVIHSEEMEITLLPEKFIFIDGGTDFEQGGFLLIFEKENNDFFFKIDKVDQGFIDGDCNDVLTDC
ncbi:MAG: hypothetical protein RIM99_02110 [Cyclobacteriaceae bacterium]